MIGTGGTGIENGAKGKKEKIETGTEREKRSEIKIGIVIGTETGKGGGEHLSVGRSTMKMNMMRKVFYLLLN